MLRYKSQPIRIISPVTHPSRLQLVACPTKRTSVIETKKSMWALWKREARAATKAESSMKTLFGNVIVVDFLNT